MNKAKELAVKISSKGQVAVKLALQSILSCNEMTFKEGFKTEAESFGKCCGTEDSKEGIKAFFEKRKPNFKNR
jgi:enoyl-CoA hydratase